MRVLVVSYFSLPDIHIKTKKIHNKIKKIMARYFHESQIQTVGIKQQLPQYSHSVGVCTCRRKGSNGYLVDLISGETQNRSKNLLQNA